MAGARRPDTGCSPDATGGWPAIQSCSPFDVTPEGRLRRGLVQVELVVEARQLGGDDVFELGARGSPIRSATTSRRPLGIQIEEVSALTSNGVVELALDFDLPWR